MSEPGLHFEAIELDIDETIATVTLNRPDKLNATNDQMLDEIALVIDLLNRDEGVRAVIFTGAGRAFCAGADLSPGVGLAGATRGTRDRGGEIALQLFDLLKPSIAAVNGPAVGFGATFLLPMDIRIASTEAKFGFVFSRLGIAPEAASSWFLPRIVGISKAVEWTTRAQVFRADEALESGLVSAIHAPGDLLPAARELARGIVTSTSPVAVVAARRMMWQMLGADHPRDAVQLGISVNSQLLRGSDAPEGMRAFIEKRPPIFTSRLPDDLPSALDELSSE